MPTLRQLVVRAGTVAAAVGVVAVASGTTRTARAARQAGAALGRRTRDVQHRVAVTRDRVTAGSPDPDVSDDVLADRVRSVLGPLEKELDVPRVHVMVEDHVVLLHGDVPALTDADRIAHAALDVSGVVGAESYLHVGLLASDTRPSSGRFRAGPSPALKKLLAAARAAGADDANDMLAVRAVLGAFSDRLPPHEREHLLGHLPDDARLLAGPPRRKGEAPARLRTVNELLAVAGARGHIDPAHVEAVARSVLGAMRQLVPEEDRDVAAVLPAELEKLWDGAVPAR
jgi:uncharacterized protein (DUF2267 family)